MLRRIASMTAALVTLTFAGADAAEVRGTWNASHAKVHSGKLDFSLQTRRYDQHGSELDRSELTGLSESDIESRTSTHVRFELRREPGTVTFEGTFQGGRGEGDFTFTPSRDYVRRLRSVGVRFESAQGDEARELLELALFDVSIDFIRSMRAIGYDVSLEKYLAFRIFDVDPGYVRDMSSVGFDHLSADRLIETRIHGATPEYIRQRRSAGEDLALDEYIESRIFQITPAFAEEMSQAGYPDLDRDMLLQFRIQGVTPDFIQSLRDVGYSNLPAEQLVQMRIFGVTPEYIRRVNRNRSGQMPVDKMIEMRIFHRDPEMVSR